MMLEGFNGKFSPADIAECGPVDADVCSRYIFCGLQQPPQLLGHLALAFIFLIIEKIK